MFRIMTLVMKLEILSSCSSSSEDEGSDFQAESVNSTILACSSGKLFLHRNGGLCQQCVLMTLEILSKSTITLTFTVLTSSRDKKRYRVTENVAELIITGRRSI